MSVIDTLTDADIEQVAKDYIGFAIALEQLTRSYSADPKGRELNKAKEKAAYYRHRARVLRDLLQGSHEEHLHHPH